YRFTVPAHLASHKGPTVYLLPTPLRAKRPVQKFRDCSLDVSISTARPVRKKSPCARRRHHLRGSTRLELDQSCLVPCSRFQREFSRCRWARPFSCDGAFRRSRHGIRHQEYLQISL